MTVVVQVHCKKNLGPFSLRYKRGHKRNFEAWSSMLVLKEKCISCQPTIFRGENVVSAFKLQLCMYFARRKCNKVCILVSCGQVMRKHLMQSPGLIMQNCFLLLPLAAIESIRGILASVIGKHMMKDRVARMPRY